MKLTVVICTHNRSELLMRTIASLNEAYLPNDCSITLLIIANSCSDDTVPLLNNYRSIQNERNLPLKFSEEPRTGKSYALNLALSLIDDGLVSFVDDDHRVDKNYFQSIKTSINQFPDASILCGQIIPDWTGCEPLWVHDEGKYKIYPLPVPHFQLGTTPIRVTYKTSLPGGGNLIIKYETFSKIGNFSTSLGPIGHNLSGSEDSDFIMRALNAGVIIQYAPTIIQYHYVDQSRLKFSYLIKKSFQRTRSYTLAKNPSRSLIPLYMWRKLLNYLLATLFSFRITKIRFYLMRIASTAGEMTGMIENRNT